MKVSAEYVERYKISVEDLPKLQGFYGSKLKAGATAVLTGIYSVPIYAQWNYGKGIVGSFMCDLNGEFSGDLLEGEAGIDLIQKLIVGAFSSPNFTLETKSDYKELLSTTFSVKARLGEGEKLSLVLKKP